MTRHHAAALCLVLSMGCVRTRVVASQISTDGTDSDGTATDGDGTAADSDGTASEATTQGSGGTDTASTTDAPPTECAPPAVGSRCDIGADPLRAFEAACHTGVGGTVFESSDPAAWRNTRQFGNAYWNSENSTVVLALSTGQLPSVGTSGEVFIAPGAAQFASVANENPDYATLPDPIVVSPGSNRGEGGTPYLDCDGVGDCSDTLPAAVSGLVHDLVWFRFEVDVPPNVYGYSVRFALLTAEYPESIGRPSSDTFVWWASGARFTGNLATYRGEPANASGLESLLARHTLGDQLLVRTGFDGAVGKPCSVEGRDLSDCPIGGATDWMELRGPAEPGEHLTIAAALFDTEDALLDTVVLLDDWHWECEGCVPGESCGLSIP